MKARAFVVVAVALLMSGPTAFAGIITFDDLGLVHGQTVSDEMPGVTISAFNDSVGTMGDFVPAAVFNTDILTSTDDPDLQRDPPGGRNSWSGGNLDPNTSTGLALFIPEDFEDDDEDGVLDDPNDEGARPAGRLMFDFDVPITTFGFDLVDVESMNDEPGRVEFRNAADVLVHTVLFSDVVTAADFGNATINRVDVFSVPSSTHVWIYMGGSGAVDNIVFGQQLPEPGTLMLLGLGLLGVARLRPR